MWNTCRRKANRQKIYVYVKRTIRAVCLSPGAISMHKTIIYIFFGLNIFYSYSKYIYAR